MADLNGHAAVDTGSQTDLARYQAIVPLGQLFTLCLLAAYSVKSLVFLPSVYIYILQCSDTVGWATGRASGL